MDQVLDWFSFITLNIFNLRTRAFHSGKFLASILLFYLVFSVSGTLFGRMLEPLVLCRAALFSFLPTLSGSFLGVSPRSPRSNLIWPVQGSVSWSCRGVADPDIEPGGNMAPGLDKGLPSPFGYPRKQISHKPALDGGHSFRPWEFYPAFAFNTEPGSSPLQGWGDSSPITM